MTQLGPETLANYELGFRFQTSRFYLRVHFFDSELKNPSAEHAAVSGERGSVSIGGVLVTAIAPSAAQRAAGVVAVATSLTPRAVHTAINDGKSRYFGADQMARYRITPRWTLEANYSFIGGLDLNPVRPARRLPPQEGGLRLRYMPAGQRPWVEVGVRLIGPQNRLNGGDIDDDRIGGSRRRSDIATFFRSYTVAPFLGTGADGRLGTADDPFAPTGETLLQIENRVLPLNSTINGVLVTGDGIRVPLYTKVPGWTALNIRAGYPLFERVSLILGVGNVLDTITGRSAAWWMLGHQCVRRRALCVLRRCWRKLSTRSAPFFPQFLGDLLHFSPNSKQIAAPHLADLFFRVAAPNQFQRDVECFRRAVPAVDSAAAIEVRRNSNVIDSDELHRVVDVIHEVLHVGAARRRELRVDLGQPLVVFRAPFG